MNDWLIYKEQYSIMMMGCHTDIGLYTPVYRPDCILIDAKDYMDVQGNREYMPGKKVATSYIWGVLASKVYGKDLIECLNDDTLIAVDDGMVLYDDLPAVYDRLMKDYSPTDLSWMANGWTPYTAFYFWAECTLEGSAVLESHYINDTIDQFIPENYLETIAYLWDRSV